MTAALLSLRALARNPVLRREAAALALYRLAEFGPWVAILVYAYDRGGATATGLVSLGILIPTALAAPFAGPLIDRLGASRVLVGSLFVQMAAMGATAAALLADGPSALVYVLAAVTAMTLTYTHPAHAVVSPGIARTTDQLVALNAVTGWILSLGLVLAPALAGLILERGSPGAVYAAGAACLALAFVVALPLRALVPPLPRDEADAAAPVRELVDGARELARAPASREVILVLAASFLMVGAFDVLAVVLAVGVLDLGGSGAGYLTAAHGAGAVLGAAGSLALVGRARLVPVMLGAALAALAGFVALSLALVLLMALVAAIVSGCARSVLEVSGQTLLQRVTSTGMLARVFAFKEGLTMAAWGLGSIAVPLAIGVAGVRGAIVVTGAVVPVVMLVRLRRLATVDQAARVPVVAIALLRTLPLFRSLPVPALEGVAHGATPTSVPAGAEIVRAGDHGDRYFAIADGEVEVVRDGSPVARLTRGEGFGEIALLHGVTRTATVVAVADSELLVIEREPFLVAVTGHAPSHEVASRVADARLPEAL